MQSGQGRERHTPVNTRRRARRALRERLPIPAARDTTGRAARSATRVHGGTCGANNHGMCAARKYAKRAGQS
eukprot:271271-Prymnesium_polylepis.1